MPEKNSIDKMKQGNSDVNIRLPNTLNPYPQVLIGFAYKKKDGRRTNQGIKYLACIYSSVGNP
jgi:hypothetical protein